MPNYVLWSRWAAPAEPRVGGMPSPPGRPIAATPFARVQSVEDELDQLGLLRILTGLICLARFAPIVWASADYFDPRAGGAFSDITIEGLRLLALIVAGTVGFASPIVFPLLVIACSQYDDVVNTQTLGTNFLNLLWGLFFLTGAGARRSVDASLLRTTHLVGAPIRMLYRLVGTPTLPQLRQIYLLYFIAFALINLGALAYHVDDRAWKSGYLLRDLLTNSYLCRAWETFRAIVAEVPALISAVSIGGSIGQAIFQAFMLPLIFTRWGSRFVIAWGAVFFTLSLLFLQLSYLPPLEWVLWWALFHRPRVARETEAVRISWRSPRAGRLVWWAGVTTLVVFAIHDAPAAARFIDIRNETVARTLRRIGLEVPLVFNADDLRMGEAWPVIYREPDDDPLPYHGLQGQRLTWVQWNDLFYFGNSLRWRRNYSGPSDLSETGDALAQLAAVARYDHRRAGATSSRYRIEYYAHAQAAGRPAASRFETKLIGVDYVECQGTAEAASCHRLAN